MMTQVEVITLLAQIPLVGIFVWFTLRLSADFRSDAKARDAEWQSFITQQNELWRGFVRDLVEKSAIADDMVSQRLFELVGIIRELQHDFKTHDLNTIRHITSTGDKKSD